VRVTGVCSEHSGVNLSVNMNTTTPQPKLRPSTIWRYLTISCDLAGASRAVHALLYMRARDRVCYELRFTHLRRGAAAARAAAARAAAARAARARALAAASAALSHRPASRQRVTSDKARSAYVGLHTLGYIELLRQQQLVGMPWTSRVV
jgi:hypothetical protein